MTKYSELIAKKFLAEVPFPKLADDGSEPVKKLLDSRSVSETCNIAGFVDGQTEYDALRSNIRTLLDVTYKAACDLYVVSNNSVIKASASYTTASPWSTSPTVTILSWKSTDTSGGAHIIRVRLSLDNSFKDVENVIAEPSRYPVDLQFARGVKLG